MSHKEESLGLVLFLASLLFWGWALWTGFQLLRGLYNYGAGLNGYPPL